LSDAIDRIRLEARNRHDEILALLQSMIHAGKSGETAVQDVFARRAEAIGCSTESIVYNPADVPMVEEFAGHTAIDPAPRTGVVAKFKGSGGGRSLILFAHPDGEKIEGTEKWRHDPFAGIIENGRVYGWGVADDLSGVAAGLKALDLILAAGLAPKGDIVIASTPSKRHARSVSHLLHSGFAADAAVYLHPAESGVGMAEIKAFTSGQVEFRVVIPGDPPPTTEPLQTAFAHQGVNAIDKAFVIWQALKELDARRSAAVSHPALNKAVGRSTNLMMSYISAGDPQRLARLAHRCVLGAALAFPPPETLSQVCRAIEDAVADAAKADEWLREHPPQVIWDSGVTGAEVPADHPLVQAAFSAVLAVSGATPRINPMHTGSDIRNPIIQKGIPTIGLGPLCGDLTQNGGTDEWVDANDHVRFVSAVAGIIAEWCGVSERR
jgi:acetylornithine deacetylase